MRTRTLPLLLAATLAPALAGAQTQAPTQQSKPAIVPMPDITLPLKHAPQPTTAAITPADLMTRLYIFADDSMQGREAGTIGNVKGTDYIAAQVKQFGLEPAGENGTYFQTIPLKTRTVDPKSSIVVNGATLAFGTDWVSASNGTITQQNVPVVFGGMLGDSTALIDSAQAAGKFVLYGLPDGPAAMRALRASRRIRRTEPGFALVAPAMLLNYFTRPTEFVDDPDAPKPPTVLLMTRAAAAKFFTASVDSMAPGTAGASANLDVQANVVPVANPARNVVAILKGSDPKLAAEYVAIGAHNDHVGFNNHPVDDDSLRIFNHIVRPGGAEDQGAHATADQQAEANTQLAAWRAKHPNSSRPDSIANGADDDGSGSVSVLEIAQQFSSLKGKDRPKRSILFVWHVGEEKGLLGSAWYTDHPTVPRDSIVAQLNMDMVGRGDAWDETGKDKDGNALHGGPNYLQIVGSHRLSTELGDLIEKVNTDDHHDLAIDYAMDANGHPMNIYCRSDHYEYARYGIPIAFFTTGGHSDYHQVTDEPQAIDYAHMAKVDNLVYDVALHVANMDHRPVVDHPKPDPKGACQQ